MILLENSKSIFKFLFYTVILFAVLFVVVQFVHVNDTSNKNEVISSNISYTDANTKINVNYPRFNNDDINKIITDIIYAYIKNFKSFDTINKVLDVNYSLYYIGDYVNIMFDIENTIDLDKNKNIIIDLKNNNIAYITNIYDKDYLYEEINNLAFHKYSNDVYNQISVSNINNHTYITSDDFIYVYFNDIKFNEIDYIPFVAINLTTEAFEYDENEYYNGMKFMAFTFDDGPSDYTLNILDTLEANSSSATFFMLGNRMKYNSEIVKKVYNSNSEIGTHTYSHKDLKNLTDEEIIEEINSSAIIYNELTGDNIKYIRPPYGSYDDSVLKNINIPMILWNVDTKDWLLRDSKKIYNNIINSACDGCIVLLHDSYRETLEAVKMVLPKLNEMGYIVVNVTDLLNLKDVKLDKNDTISYAN